MRHPRVAFSEAPFETAIALAALLSAVVYLFDPASAEATALSQTAQELLPAWEALYGVGGLLIILGLWFSLRVEAAGLCLFIAAVGIQSITILDIHGVTGVVAATTFAAISIAGIARIVVLFRAWSKPGRG